MPERRRFKQTTALEQRLKVEADRLRQKADTLPPGDNREAALRKAQEAERASQMTDWLTSPSFQPSK
jgi:hypothetical protein